MTAQASSNTDSGNSTADVGFEAGGRMNGIESIPTKPAHSDSAKLICHGKRQVVSGVKNRTDGFSFVNFSEASAFSNQSGEIEIRHALIETDLAGRMV